MKYLFILLLLTSCGASYQSPAITESKYSVIFMTADRENKGYVDKGYAEDSVTIWNDKIKKAKKLNIYLGKNQMSYNIDPLYRPEIWPATNILRVPVDLCRFADGSKGTNYMYEILDEAGEKILSDSFVNDQEGINFCQ